MQLIQCHQRDPKLMYSYTVTENSDDSGFQNQINIFSNQFGISGLLDELHGAISCFFLFLRECCYAVFAVKLQKCFVFHVF